MKFLVLFIFTVGAMNLLQAGGIEPTHYPVNLCKYSQADDFCNEHSQIDKTPTDKQKPKKKKKRIRAADQWATIEPEQTFNRITVVQIDYRSYDQVSYHSILISGNRKRGPPFL